MFDVNLNVNHLLYLSKKLSRNDAEKTHTRESIQEEYFAMLTFWHEFL